MKKIIKGRPCYYPRETAWVDGCPTVVRTNYLGRGEDIERRLAEWLGRAEGGRGAGLRGGGSGAAAGTRARRVGGDRPSTPGPALGGEHRWAS
jgi:hypothetical protein